MSGSIYQFGWVVLNNKSVMGGNQHTMVDIQPTNVQPTKEWSPPTMKGSHPTMGWTQSIMDKTRLIFNTIKIKFCLMPLKITWLTNTKKKKKKKKKKFFRLHNFMNIFYPKYRVLLLNTHFTKNPAYGKPSISWCVRIVTGIQKNQTNYLN